MSSTPAQTDRRGSLSPESGPQVVVRAGKTFVCSACGTLVEVLADVVGQMVLAVDPSPQDEPVETEPAGKVPAKAKTRPSRPKKISPARPSRPKRPEQPERVSLVGEIIDGLQVPTAKKLDRALAWVSFHLKVLDRQGSEIKRLQKLLKQRSMDRVPRPSPLGRAKEVAVEVSIGTIAGTKPRHAQADLGAAPTVGNTKERGPP
ncbi:hypothetical protein Pan97_35400 [Bremerella volcania]|uniref:Uncharacterized protein n=1 Tax=Bremerella volcania TaxID=2527984 RepID=A0A518CBA6_9BACT|nr:hypothetical protein [Bremerella volcania]QDU76490.1 hypothetical protein Pan97_35400 [Bremerella volcania]